MDVTSEGAAGYAGGSYSAGEHYSKDGDIGYTTRGMPTLSLQNVTSSIMPIPPVVTGAVGDNAEDFEVTDYSAQIETGKLESTCASIKELKGRSYVIFENANESDSYCSYTFKVKHENVEEVLAFIKDLDPKDLSESTYTIKRQIDDYTSEEEVLTSKKKSIEDTLKSALSAYDEITSLATRTQDTETLAKIIDSRIGIIERLTQQSIAVNEQLDRLARSKADSLDRLEYAFFNVSIYENTFIDGENLADSWKAAIKQFVVDVNAALLAATVGLIGFLLTLVPFALYFLVLLILAKVGWKVVRRVWQK